MNQKQALERPDEMGEALELIAARKGNVENEWTAADIRRRENALLERHGWTIIHGKAVRATEAEHER